MLSTVYCYCLIYAQSVLQLIMLGSERVGINNTGGTWLQMYNGDICSLCCLMLGWRGWILRVHMAGSMASCKT